MDEEEKEHPEIIVKKKKDHGGHHGGAWKVAYADFVTAMMALFIVLWVLSQGEEVQKAVAGYFKDPVGFDINASTPIQRSESSFIKMDLDAKRREQIKKFNEVKESLKKEFSHNKNYSKLMDQIEFVMVDEGMRIEIVESNDEVFFKVGSAVLNKTAEEIIVKIGEHIKNLPNKIVIEGHTDSRPYIGSALNYTNFDLSTDRANSARKALMTGGISLKQIDEISGYADKQLRNKKDPYSVVNRRISITLKYLSEK
jgi:chemotaxis protein MotB